jgi:hypothetical protein
MEKSGGGSESQQDGDTTSNAVNIGALASLFEKWPGPTLMAVGAALIFAATGIRVDGLAFSGHDFAGMEFAAVFLGGILLIAVGVAVLLVRDRLLVEDAQRLRAQEHEQALEKARSAFVASYLKTAQLAEAGRNAGEAFESAYNAAVERGSDS